MVSNLGFLQHNKNSLDTSLQQILNEGFLFMEECFFLRTFFPLCHVQKSDFIDKTGYECFVNSFHTDDYVGNNHLQQSILFAEKLFEKWRNENRLEILKCIISKSEYGAVVKFHIIRLGEEWIDESNIDKFEEPICILTSALIVKN